MPLPRGKPVTSAAPAKPTGPAGKPRSQPLLAPPAATRVGPLGLPGGPKNGTPKGSVETRRDGKRVYVPNGGKPTFVLGPNEVVSPNGGPCDNRLYLRRYGYTDEQITAHYETLALKTKSRLEGEIRAAEERAEAERLRAEAAAAAKTTSGLGITTAATKPVENPLGVHVRKSEAGRVTIYGEGLCSIFRWVGAQGWGREEVDKLRAALGIEGCGADASVKNELGLGAKGTNVPKLAADQVAKLSLACGHGASEPEPEPEPVPVKPVKRAVPGSPKSKK